MHNEVRVDPLGQVAEYDETDNIEFEDTTVATGNDGIGAFNQLTITKSQVSPAGNVATNGILIYDLEVANLGTDPVSAIVVKDFLPAGSRFIEAKDTDVGIGVADAFFCAHDGQAYGGTVTCTGGDLSGTVNTIVDTPGPGLVPTVRNIRITVFAPNTPGVYPNSAVVDPNNVVPEGNEFDNDSQITTTVAIGAANEFNELTVAKTQTDPAGNAVATSSIVTWEIVVTNTGSDPAFNVRLTDMLPSGFTFIAAVDTSGPSDPFRFVCAPAAGNTVDCTGATLSGTVNVAGTSPTTRTIVLRAYASAIPGIYTNTVIVDPANAIPEGNETNNTANASVDVSNGGPGAFIDLEVDKQALIPVAGTPVAPGGQLAYTLTVTNTGAAPAFNVVVRDVLPAHVTFFNAADGTVGPGMFTCAQASGVVNCSGGQIPAGGSRTILVLMIAPTSIEQYATSLTNISVGITNQAFVDPDNAILEGNEINNADSVDTTVTPPVNLTLTKEGPTNATQNQTTEYTITVKNNITWGAGGLARGVRVVDGLPTGLIPIGSVQAGGNFVCQVLENPVNYVSCLGDLAADDEVTITIPVFITADGGVLDNEACVDPDRVVAETNELDNCAHALTQVGPAVEPANLSIDKTASTGSVTAGQEFTYTVAVSNIGGTDATGTITMTDDLPSAVELMGVNPASGWSCPLPLPATPNLVECTRTGLAAGSTESIVISVKTKTGVGAPTTAFTNHAEVSGNSEVEFDEVIVGVGGAGTDLLISDITDTPDPVNRTKELTWTIVAVNAGTADADGAVVRVQLPDAGVTVSGVTATNGFNCVVNPAILPAGMTYDCTAGVVTGFPASSDTTITVVATVNLGAPDELVLTATADPANAFVESDEVNNTLTQTTTVDDSVCTSSPCVDLVVSSIIDVPDGAPFGPPVVYTVAVTNVGDAPLPTNVPWDIHFELVGAGVITSITVPTGVTCAPGGAPTCTAARRRVPTTWTSPPAAASSSRSWSSRPVRATSC